MATTLGPDMMLGTHPSSSPDDATTRAYALPALVDAALKNLPSDSPMASPRNAMPPPNPHFVFPARPSSSSAPSSFSRATGRRTRSTIDVNVNEPALMISTTEDAGSKPRSPALPSFSFNPGAALPPSLDSPFLVPPQSPPVPESPRSIPVRPASHRRGGSEFVGGKMRSGDAVTVLSSSPTKSENGMPSPMLQPQPARPNRPRGHAHRRSAAISSHDLSSIILPSPGYNMRGSSAPASPALLDVHDKEFPAPTAAPSEPKASSPTVERPADASSSEETPVVDTDAAPKMPSRNRVGFSDTLEFIPRPLSLVSNETSSTVTARPGHSLSGSISSVISLTNPDRDLSSPIGFSASRKMNETRPSTAGAVLERTQSNQEEDETPASPRRRGSIPCLGTLPPPSANIELATPSPTKPGKKWSFFSLEPFAASPTRLRPISAGSSESQKESSSRHSSEQAAQCPDVKPADVLEATKPLTKKRSKKQKKVKTWAGSILSRKSKSRHGKQKRRTPTPPPVPYNGSGMYADMDDDALDMAAEPELQVPSVLVTGQDGEDENWASSSAPDEDSSYPMIDLDAALGPFNTPLPRNAEWEAAQRAGGHVKKQLHSAAGMSRFTGPGMHYHHRRAESAPEMVPFDAGRLGFPRFGSSSTMADVFEEDEEDDDSAGQSTGQSTPVGDAPTADKSEDPKASQDSMSTSSNALAARPATSDGAFTTRGANEPHSISPSESDKFLETPRLNFSRSTTSLQDDAIPEDQSVFTFASAPRKSVDSVAPSPRQTQRPKDLAPVDVSPLNLPTASLAPISPYSMTQSSAFPSPRSPMSYDAHRISTAPSSITEDNFQSLLMGEPGPEVRISVDDIPSLTSSNSTMTRDSLFAQHARFPPASKDQPRPASFTSTAFGRRRSSLASLSRLISSSHGERSKLSMEVPMDNEPEKSVKSSKTKRLSRLMQFWKAKDDKTAQC
ncbi:hypothetical protein QBC39DRAFT_118900 [Podospora conica]|nr:hypothetical protein QBC39DRAFT_118900 [Schizothecium conicum]